MYKKNSPTLQQFKKQKSIIKKSVTIFGEREE
jgi:hypothetical protein